MIINHVFLRESSSVSSVSSAQDKIKIDVGNMKLILSVPDQIFHISLPNSILTLIF